MILRDMPPNPHTDTLNREQYWRRTRRLTFILLSIWFLVTIAVVMFARPLSTVTLFGWSASYYMAAQGTILVYVAIVGLYTWRMSKLDKRFASEDNDGK
jgi:putative solute:sodium symporter small subunit